jgi:hypothetical protein
MLAGMPNDSACRSSEPVYDFECAFLQTILCVLCRTEIEKSCIVQIKFLFSCNFSVLLFFFADRKNTSTAKVMNFQKEKTSLARV